MDAAGFPSWRLSGMGAVWLCCCVCPVFMFAVAKGHPGRRVVNICLGRGLLWGVVAVSRQLTSGFTMNHAARKILLPRLIVTEVVDETADGAVCINIPPGPLTSSSCSTPLNSDVITAGLVL